MTTTREHLLAIVEPTTGGDATLDLAHDVVERGGAVSLVLMVTKRVLQDIAEFADGADLEIGEAEAIALDRLSAAYEQRVGATESTRLAYAASGDGDLRRYLTPETTAIAIPAHLASRRAVRRLGSATGLPIVVAPLRAA